MSKIRLLRADEIECRVSRVYESSNSYCCDLLLYKDARCDMRILDETFGTLNWKREHQEIGGRLYCTIYVRNSETGEWIGKQDVGTESNAEKEKGQASDSFKRAGFNWGIGRELYTSPRIKISLSDSEVRDGKAVKTRFKVTEIRYNDNREIVYLEICDPYKVRFVYGEKQNLDSDMLSKEQRTELANMYTEFYGSKERARNELKMITGKEQTSLMTYNDYEFAVDILNRRIHDMELGGTLDGIEIHGSPN